MKNLFLLTTLALATMSGACSTTASQPQATIDNTGETQLQQPVSLSNETLLLVSLEDGSVIMQTINSDADICFKKNSDSATTCLVQGKPIIDPLTQAVIGFETMEAHIDLVAKSTY